MKSMIHDLLRHNFALLLARLKGHLKTIRCGFNFFPGISMELTYNKSAAIYIHLILFLRPRQ